jgi:hypothetical protein
MPKPKRTSKKTDRRAQLLDEVESLASIALIGSLSETYRTCGNRGCRCHHGGPKHGPHLYVSYRGDSGKTSGYYVPAAAHTRVREGIAAWKQLKETIRELAQLNQLELRQRVREQTE